MYFNQRDKLTDHDVFEKKNENFRDLIPKATTNSKKNEFTTTGFFSFIFLLDFEFICCCNWNKNNFVQIYIIFQKLYFGGFFNSFFKIWCDLLTFKFFLSFKNVVFRAFILHLLYEKRQKHTPTTYWNILNERKKTIFHYKDVKLRIMKYLYTGEKKKNHSKQLFSLLS